MEDKTDIGAKIRRSDAFKSLQSEKAVSDCLKKYGWGVLQSPYYVDPKTAKARELDVTGSAYWRKDRKSGDLIARVNLFVEVKSNSDYHILCGGPAKVQTHFNANEHWLGYSEETTRRIEELLSRSNLGFEQIKKILQRIERIAFPSDTMRTSTLRIDPPAASENYSAFRETNGTAEKELDNSVLWRAVLALRSAIQAAQIDIIDGFIGDLATDLEAARRSKSAVENGLSSVESHACRLNLYVPIVVIQSRIWSASDELPKEMKWARLVQYNTFGSPDGWIDVVQSRHFEHYVDAITKHFKSAFKRSRAKRWM